MRVISLKMEGAPPPVLLHVQQLHVLTLLVAGGCFYPPLGFFLNISQTDWAKILKFSDFS